MSADTPTRAANTGSSSHGRLHKGVYMSNSPEFSIVKVHTKDGFVLGAGTLIGKKWVLTCWHVIKDLPSDEVYLTFYLDKSNKSLKSHVYFSANEEELDIPQILMISDKNANILCSFNFSTTWEDANTIIDNLIINFDKLNYTINNLSFDRTKLGNYTVIIEKFQAFHIVYIFIGNTF